jgi:hypothetical protein
VTISSQSARWAEGVSGKVCHRVSATDLEMRQCARGVRARLAYNLPVFTLDFRSHSKLR